MGFSRSEAYDILELPIGMYEQMYRATKLMYFYRRDVFVTATWFIVPNDHLFSHNSYKMDKSRTVTESLLGIT